MAKKKKIKAHLVGFATTTDEHKRITKGENFTLLGGTKEGHERMQETAIKINENLDKRGKTLETVESEELRDIIQKSSE